MIRNPDLDALRAGVRQFADLSSKEKFQQLRRHGLIRHDMTVQDWNAFLAVLEVRCDSSGRAVAFWCLQPTLSSPGTAKIEICRDSMVRYLRENRRVITAIVDPDSKALDSGEDIHLTSDGSIRTDANDIAEDNLGELPRYNDVRSRM
jgi:hypothetical protein